VLGEFIVLKKLFIYFFISLLICFYFLDLSFTTSSNKIELFFSLFFVNLLYIVSFLLYKKALNPVVFIFPFLLGFLYYQFHLSYLQNPLSIETYVVIFLFFLFYFLGCILFNKNKYSCKDSTVSYTFINFILLCGSLVFIYELYLNGGLSIVKTVQGSNAYVEKITLPILHYFYMLLALLPSCYYYLYKNNRIKKIVYLLFSFFCFFMIFDSLSRQLILLSIFTYFFCYIKLNDLSLDKQFAKLIIFVGLSFILIGSLRYMGGATDTNELDFMKAYAQIKENYDVNIFDITFNLYTAKNFSTLNDMIEINGGVFHLGKYLFQAYIKIFHYNDAFNIQYSENLDSYTLLGTIIADLYLDFGIIGVVILSFTYGLLANYSYQSYINSKSLSSILLVSVVFYSLFMSPFTNYFNQLFILICFLFALSFRIKYSNLKKEE